MNWNLKGKKALLTGSTKGIGLAAAHELAALGAEVFINARNPEEVGRTVAELERKGHRAAGLAADLSTAEGREQLLLFLGRHWDRLDILVNNVGMNIRKSFTDYAESEYRQIFETNLMSALALTQACYPLLKKAAPASVINVASVAGLVDVRSGAPYGMTKAAMLQMTRHLAVEWAPAGIRVNAVSPWYTRTPLAEPVLQQPDRLERILDRTPMGRIAEAEEMAGVIAFLAMEASSYVTGQNIVADGGMTVSGL